MIRILELKQFVPYGFLSENYEAAATVPPVPFKANPDLYKDLVRELVAELAKNIWPRFNAEMQVWEGAATAWVGDLTKEDLDLGTTLAPRLSMSVSAANSRASTHLDLFLEEDGYQIDPDTKTPDHPYFPWGASFNQYDRSFDLGLCQKLSEAIDGPGASEAGGLDLALKAQMQRPRPFQTAMQMGYPSYFYKRARTAATPSLVSGHALQGLIGGGLVFKEHRQDLLKDGDVLSAWAQFIVDIGDRRVFAGVHYPSDSLSSWFCALRAVPAFYGSEEGGVVKEFLWSAIQKSRVYQAMKGAAKPESRHAALLAWLEGEAQPAKAVSDTRR